jgi:enoyl-CoA hydratase/carnithine racemase
VGSIHCCFKTSPQYKKTKVNVTLDMKLKSEIDQFTTLKVELLDQGNILHLQLNRPKAFNALSAEMITEIHTLLDICAHPTSMLDPHFDFKPRVILLAAAPPAFSGGVDVKAAFANVGGQSWDYKNMRSQQLLSRLIHKMRDIPQPIVACIPGPAHGAGLSIALASDIRVASKTASFSAAFVKLGLSGTDMGTSFFLPRHAGMGIAAEMLLTGRTISAERAYQVGLVNTLVSDEEEEEDGGGRGGGGGALIRAGLDYCREMVKLSPQGLMLTKEQINSTADGGSLKTAMVGENSHQMFLVNEPEATKQAEKWASRLLKSKL